MLAFFVRLRRNAAFAANAGNKRRKPHDVEMQRLTEERYDDDDETVMYERTDNSSRT